MHDLCTFVHGAIRTSVLVGVISLFSQPKPVSVCQASDFPPETEITATYPPYGYIYPGQDEDLDGNPEGLSEFWIWFSGPVQLAPSMLSLSVTGGEKPAVASVEGTTEDAVEWRIVLDRPIPSGEATWIELPNGHMIQFAALPGDVNQDGIVSAEDEEDFLRAYSSLSTDVLWHDIDGDGIVDLNDYDRLLELHDSAGVELGCPVSEKSTIVCCTLIGTCSIYTDDCPDGTTQITCPCPPPSG